jgi:hypothetical protein
VKSSLRFVSTVCLFCCVIFALSSCAEQQEGGGRGLGRDGKKFECIVVLPTEAFIDSNRRIDFVETKKLQDGAAFIDGVLAEELKSFRGARILNGAQSEGFMTETSRNKMALVKNIGRELKCEAILMATVSRFHQREGGEYAADNPASASFEMQLYRVEDGKVIWSGSFDETQESLLSNLLSFGKAQSRGFKWVTVEELVRQGVHERLTACPYL